jgi:uncharacterized protein YecA (UPF0149 family)
MTDPAKSIPLPAVCSTCGAIFPSAIEVPNGVSNIRMRFKEAKFGPCLHCLAHGRHSYGEIPAEWIDLSRPDVAAALSAPTSASNFRTLAGVLASASREELSALRDALANTEGMSAGEVADSIERAVPRNGGLADWLRQRENRLELQGYIAIIIAFIGVLLMVYAIVNGVTAGQIEQLIRAVNREQRTEQALIQTVKQQQRTEQSRSPGRNEPCYCGSEIKFKFCHDAPPSRQRVKL